MSDMVIRESDFPTISVVGNDKKTEADQSPFSDEEKSDFNEVFSALFKVVNRYDIPPLVTKQHYKVSLFSAQLYKKLYNGAEFTGDGTTGWGMRAIIPEDVYSNAPLNNMWLKSNGVELTNWHQGLQASLWSQNDHGNAARDTLAYNAAAALPIRLQDGTQDPWSVCYWGLIDHLGAGICTGYVLRLNRRDKSYTDISMTQSESEHGYSELGYAVSIDHTIPYGTGLQFRPMTGVLASGADLAIQSEVAPMGVSFVSATRSLNPNFAAATRPIAG